MMPNHRVFPNPVQRRHQQLPPIRSPKFRQENGQIRSRQQKERNVIIVNHAYPDPPHHASRYLLQSLPFHGFFI
jgi:hypothetical protein